MPEKRKRQSLQATRSLLVVVIVGFVIALLGLLALLWPTGQYGEQGVVTMPHLLRIVRGVSENLAFSLARRLLDVGIYIVVLIGVGTLVVAWRRGTRGALLGLVGIGVLGLSYVSGMALYTGPMVSTCGFLLILIGGAIAWVTVGDDDDDDQENSPEEITEPANPVDRTDISDLGTDEYALHPIA